MVTNQESAEVWWARDVTLHGSALRTIVGSGFHDELDIGSARRRLLII